MSTTREPHQNIPSGPSRPSSPSVADPSPIRHQAHAQGALRYVGALIRISLGWIFLWAFLDKLFGLGHDTASDAAWINGGHPTAGFLKGGTSGPLADFYQGLAGQAWVDWVFMIGLLGIGLALLLGIGMRLAAIAGAIMLVLMWSAVLPPANNPFMDDHLIYALVLVALALGNAGNTLGFGRQWQRTNLVQRWPILT
ncbi:thiosulfate dehydrogenase [quinone] large subunit [Sanguibacter gelidistatuariae]|uniref:Thiosulfate dehydrogenase [quinone] large subunit n=1 Tax=Sanguibacter gelidistatuariae TaxID=1814289 RepID=A0A1G6K230_9MICO|nr:DoxX family membrane protein [Sanguibacter gelidistatuariae]SDC24983.1 thiosulfate dehydrogenase [quinone] large subunit [Sanguibacter gelidistatuariae]